MGCCDFFSIQNLVPRRVACSRGLGDIQPAAYGACWLETPPMAPPEEAEEDLPHVEGLAPPPKKRRREPYRSSTPPNTSPREPVEGLPPPLPYNQHPVPLVNSPRGVLEVLLPPPSPRGGWEGLLPPPIPGWDAPAFRPEPWPEPWPRGLPSSKDLEPSESSEETRSWESW